MSYALSNMASSRSSRRNHGMRGFGADPMACPAPKWIYSDVTGDCICAPGYAPSTDGNDCIQAGSSDYTGYSTLPYYVNQHDSGDDAGALGPGSTTTAPGTVIGGSTSSGTLPAQPAPSTSPFANIPTWALIGGGVLAAVVLFEVL